MQIININDKCIVKDTNLLHKVLFIDNFDEKNVAIKPHHGKYDKPLWFPKNIVFEYDELLIEKLKKAFESRDVDQLKEIWKSAKTLG